MPKAEVGSTKYLANRMKMKGLQRLRWYCQVCERQMRDANGFKQHVMSEPHIRKMQVVGEDPKKAIEGFSKEFQRDFISLLRTSHGEKYIGVNRFYQEYIRNKEHIHLNSTRWSSLTEFSKYLGREGIVNVKEDEKDGLMIAWKDVSVDAVRRRQDILEKEAAEMKNGAGEDKMLARMAKRAREQAEAKAKVAEPQKTEQDNETPASTDAKVAEVEGAAVETQNGDAPKTEGESSNAEAAPAPKPAPVKMSFGMKTKISLQKPGLAQAKKPNVLKRARTEKTEKDGDEKSVKKVKP